MQPFGLWQTFNVATYMRLPGSMPFPFPFLLSLAAVIAFTATFGCSPPDFTQADLRLLDHFFAPILIISPSLLLFPRFLLPLKILVAMLLPFHLPIGLPAIFSHPESAI